MFKSPSYCLMLPKVLLKADSIDYELVRFSYFLGMRILDPELAILALEMRIKNWPNDAVDGWLKLGKIYDAPEARDERKALQSYRAALKAAQPFEKAAVLAAIPPTYRGRLQ